MTPENDQSGTIKRYGEASLSVFFLSAVHCIKRKESMLPWVCSVVDHGKKVVSE